MRDNLRRVVLHRFLLNDPEDMQGSRFGAADMADAVTARAGNVRRFGQRGPQPLPRQFHQAKTRDFAQLYARAIVFERITEAVFDFALVLCAFHVDEVDDDQTA